MTHYPLHRDTELTSPDLPAIEDDVLAFWKADGTFQASIDQREAGEDSANEFVFYDGPPFANGLLHYGHLLTGYVKDVVRRFQTQQGRRVERRWTVRTPTACPPSSRPSASPDHGQDPDRGDRHRRLQRRLPVLRPHLREKEWEDYVTRQARWVDFANDYKTMDTPFMESVIWAFKRLYDKGLAYEGYRVLPYCWKDQTPLSNHELRMDDDVYQDRQDQTVTVGLRLEDRRAR